MHSTRHILEGELYKTDLFMTPNRERLKSQIKINLTNYATFEDNKLEIQKVLSFLLTSTYYTSKHVYLDTIKNPRDENEANCLEIRKTLPVINKPQRDFL